MMAALQSNKEYEKGPKKTFAPPIHKSHNMKPPIGDSLMENIPGIHSKADVKSTLPDAKPSLPEAKPSLPEAKPSLPEAKPSLPESASLKKKKKKKKKKKTETENNPSRGQEKKRKTRDKPAERRRKEKSTFTNEEFEEIFQAVLQKSFQECLESSYVRARIHVQPDKEPGVASLATGNENADGEMAVEPEPPEISSSLENEVVSEIRTFKLDQPVPEPKNKFNRLSLNKRRKEETDEEKVEYIQDEREHRPEVQQKTAVQRPSQFRGQQKEEKSGFGQCLIWVQCSSSKCEKWRRLSGNIDPSVLPDNWSCDQNPDVNYNRCDIPEEAWTGCESDVAYASYVPGSIIWAKQYGYPWWPGMVESDPDLGEYFLFASHLDSLPSKYHVTFFGDTVSRAWIPVNMLKNFQELSLELTGVKKCKNKDYSQKLGAAIMMAHEAEQTNIQERVNLFGFWSRYNASDNSGEGKELMVSLESCLEKEEKDSVEEKENEEKKVLMNIQPWKRASACDFPDTILLGPKPAKVQTKKAKSRDMTDGQDRVLKKRALKKSLGSKASSPLVPRMGGEEGQRTSASDTPGPKKKFKAPESKVSATNLPEDKEVKIVSECPAPPAHHGGCLLVGKEGPGPQEPPVQEAVRFFPEDEASSGLEFEQLMEDVGGESEGRGELQHGESSEEFLAVLFEE